MNGVAQIFAERISPDLFAYCVKYFLDNALKRQCYYPNYFVAYHQIHLNGYTHIENHADVCYNQDAKSRFKVWSELLKQGKVSESEKDQQLAYEVSEDVKLSALGEQTRAKWKKLDANTRINGENITGWYFSFCFNGRATRSEFWMAHLRYLLASIVLAIPFVALPAGIVAATKSCAVLMLVGSVIYGVACLFFAVSVLLTVCVRRLHDRGMSGWWMVVFFVLNLIPFIGFVSWVIELVILGLLDGIVGANQFGDDPKGRNCSAV